MPQRVRSFKNSLPLYADGLLHLVLIFVFHAAFFQNFVLFQVKDLFSNDSGAGLAAASAVEGIIARRGHTVKYTCQKNNETWQGKGRTFFEFLGRDGLRPPVPPPVFP